jgi:Protein of unknown function (DUF2934)
MPEPSEQDIIERAFEIWERNGRPDGRANEFWYQAEQELRNVDPSNIAIIPEPLT